jgi:Flp pilus assembly CpaE family ATPase
MPFAKLLVLTAEPELLAAVQAAANTSAAPDDVLLCKSMVELRSRLAQGEKSRTAALVDIDEDPPQILFELTKTVTAHPDIPFVVLAEQFDEKLVLQAMQAGARHFLRKSSIGPELDTVLGRLLLHEPARVSRLGDVVAVFSCSGGCGTTTTAVNVAAELQLAGAGSVLLVDLDPHYGSVASCLGVEGKYGIANILDRADTIDRHLVESSVIPYREGLDVLLSPAAALADRYKPMNYENLLHTLDACRESHRYVVLDAPRLPHRALVDLASVARVAVIVLRLSLRDVAHAKNLIALLTEQGMAPDRILIVANQAKKRGGLLNAVEVRDALGGRPLFRVRSDWRKALRSTHRAQPLAQSARLSGLRRDLRLVAKRVQEWTANGQTEKGGT